MLADFRFAFGKKTPYIVKFKLLAEWTKKRALTLVKCSCVNSLSSCWVVQGLNVRSEGVQNFCSRIPSTKTPQLKTIAQSEAREDLGSGHHAYD